MKKLLELLMEVIGVCFFAPRETWDRIRPIMARCHLGEFSSKDGRIFQRTELTSEQVNILNRMKIAQQPSV